MERLWIQGEAVYAECMCGYRVRMWIQGEAVDTE
jgi:hypothetical protein